MPTSKQRIAELRAKATHARDMAGMLAHDQMTMANLRSYAADLDKEADGIEAELAAIIAKAAPPGRGKS